MNMGFQYFRDSNKALEYVGKRVDNGSELEVIAAECVTSKKDFEARAEMRPELPVNMIVMKVTFSNEDDADIYNERYDLLLDWMNELATCGVRFDQFVITCNEKQNGNFEYYIVASLVDKGGYNVDIRHLTTAIENATENFQLINELTDKTCFVVGHEVELPMPLNDVPCDSIRYGSLNPLNHELVLPFRDGIFASLKKILFYC